MQDANKLRIISGIYKNRAIKMNKKSSNSGKKIIASDSLKDILKIYKNHEAEELKDIIIDREKSVEKNNSRVRPTLIRSRRMIFDTLQSIEKGHSQSFLDVFAGSGIMGIEALSRGSQKVVFFDINKRNIKTIEENLKEMPKISGAFSTICGNSLLPPDGSPMDVIFLDPPYDKIFIIPKILKNLIIANWINEKTTIILECSAKNQLSLELNDQYSFISIDNFGEFILFKDIKISNSIIQFFYYKPQS